MANPLMPASDEVVAVLREAAAGGARIALICTGTFMLAATGLLDGLRATTHWRAAPDLAARYPAITVDANVPYVDNGQFLTSAGAAAGLDLCLHMVRRDYGAAVAAGAARLAVMPLEREGGQAQFIVHEPPHLHATLAPLLHWMGQNLHRPLSLDDIVRQAARVRRAQKLLKTTALLVEQMALQVEFDSADTLPERFAKAFGVSPTGYRRAMGARWQWRGKGG